VIYDETLPAHDGSTAKPLWSKVPEVTVMFWVIKALTTAMGESASDYLVHALPPVLAVALGAAALMIALLLQFNLPRYVPWAYWLAVAMVGVFGTMAADVLHVGLGVPYAVSTVFFAAALTSIFVLWFRIEGTLSIHSILTTRRELFYWASVVTTFALGTAAGDLAAVSLHLGYLTSGMVFLVVILVPAVGWWRWHLNPVFAFWFAYIITRPLGASFADWAGVSHARGGLDLGAGPVALTLAILIISAVLFLTVARRDALPTPAAPGGNPNTGQDQLSVEQGTVTATAGDHVAVRSPGAANQSSVWPLRARRARSWPRRDTRLGRSFGDGRG
jgi:uncharacterized membrane-anchored protein